MREELIETFDKIYVMDLHGNSLLKETAPDGSSDKNVFDIQQGVAILIAVKEESSGENGLPAEVFYYDLWGSRDYKYTFLATSEINSIEWETLNPIKPNYFLAPKDFDLNEEYLLFWSVASIFSQYAAGVKTRRDNLLVDLEREVLANRFRDIAVNDDLEYLKKSYRINDTKYWNIAEAKMHISKDEVEKKISEYVFRPFDIRWVYYEPNIIERGDARWNLMRHLLESNLSLLSMRGIREEEFNHFFVCDKLVSKDAVSIKDNAFVFPLYLYPDTQNEQGNLFAEKKPNFSESFLKNIRQKLGYTPTPEAIFYYIYAIFHSPTYRQRYAEFLKIDFPRVPLTANKKLFKALGTKGEELVELHLMKSKKLNKLITKMGGEGDNAVTKISYNPKERRVYINKNRYFEGIDPEIWKFQIGGYQVLDKWLKDRKKAKRTLSFNEVLHYQKVVVALQ
jgi:predicted helicase